MSLPISRMALQSLAFTAKARAPSSCLMASQSHHIYQKSFYTLTAAACCKANPRNISTPSGALNLLSFTAIHTKSAPRIASASVSSFHTSSTVMDNQSTETVQKKPETRPCWKCSTPVPYMAYLCSNPECRAVQTLAPGANYFEVLGLRLVCCAIFLFFFFFSFPLDDPVELFDSDQNRI